MSLSNITKTKIFYAAAIAAVLAFIGYAKLSLYSLASHHEVSACFVDQVKTVGREQAILVKYHFYIEGKLYNSTTSFSRSQMSYENFKLLENKSFPLAYDLQNKGLSSSILIFPIDYEAFNMSFPDSLKWILPLMKK